MAAADYKCRSGKQCEGRNKDGPAIVAKDPTLCAGCVTALQRQREELPHLAAALHLFMAVTPKSALQSKVNSTPEPACPIDPRVDELIGDIEDTIDRCDEMRIADLITQPAMKFYVWFGERRTQQYLAGWERAIAVRRVHARANAILGFDRLSVRRAAPCPQCALPSLRSYVGESTVWCGEDDCGYAASLDDYDQLCIELAEEKK